MRTSLLAALSLPLLLAGCGAGDDEGTGPTGCRIQIGSETLACTASALDYATLSPEIADWCFQLVGTRPDGHVMATVQIFLPGRPTLGQAYGWNDATTSVVDGWATFSTIASTGSVPYPTHEAQSPLVEDEPGTGVLTASFTAIPPPGATAQEQLLAIDGTVDATLVATDESGRAVPLHAEF
jgi:hypothetical protein